MLFLRRKLKAALLGSPCCRSLGSRAAEHKGRLLSQLKACTNLQRGKEIHAATVQSGSGSCVYVAAALVNMYAKCRSMADAHQVFDRIKCPDVVSWTALILGYVKNGEAGVALDLFARMKFQGCAPDLFTFVAALKACICLAVEQDGNRRVECLELGKRVHSEIGCSLDIYVQNTLIDMYAKCGSTAHARKVFDSIKQPDVVSWTVLILGYAENGEAITALNLFASMNSRGYAPNSITFVAALKACTSLALHNGGSRKSEALEQGKRIHSESSCYSDTCLQNSLIDMYSKCGSMSDARRVFERMKHQDVVSWHALILGYAENEDGATALNMYIRMRSQGFSPNAVTYIAALKACSCLAMEQNGHRRAECLEHGKRIHSEIGCIADIYVQNTLIDMYAKCGSMADAFEVFCSMKSRNVVSWNTLITGYANNGESATTLELFARMKSQGYAPTYITFVAVLKACCLLGDLAMGRRIHAEEVNTGIDHPAILVTCLVDFYAKCGSLVEAQNVFDSQPRTRDLATWNALLAGYGRLGDDNAVFGMLKGMQDAGFRPDGVTLLGVLTCCSHAGLVEKANEFFRAMLTSYRIAPAVEHCNCMTDLLGRSNKLDEAMALLRGVSCRLDSVTWMTVLDASRKWKNAGIGSLAFQSLLSMNDANASAHVLMASLYGEQEEQEMRDRKE